MTCDLDRLLAARTGHFRYESGHHGDSWLELDSMFSNPAALQPCIVELGRRLAAHRIDAVCGPLVGGAFVARALALEIGAAFFYAERFEGPPLAYRIPDAQRDRLHGKRVALVDDAINAGSAVGATLAELHACGAIPVVLGALIVFGGAAAQIARENHLALEALSPRTRQLWPATECPFCARGVPLSP